MSAARRAIGVFAFLLALGWTGLAHAQLGVGTTWLRTDPKGQGIILSVEACCNGGLRFIWHIPSMGGQPASTMTVDSPMNGTEAPVLIGGKRTGQTMVITRVDDHHYSAIVKMNGQPFGTSHGSVAADNQTMTVDSVYGIGSQAQKTIETWVRK
jgi:hypothetical protein